MFTSVVFFLNIFHTSRLSEQYQKLPWLCGCPDSKALYCFPCLVFAKDQNKTKWNTSGFYSLSNLSADSKSHMKNPDHLAAATALSLLGKVRINEEISTAAAQQRSQHNAEVKRNRDFLEHHIRATVFLATQGLGFRGHDETKDSHNRGNFVKLLETIQHYSGNRRLAECLFEEDRPVFSGLSSSIQNDLIECLYDEVIESIKHEVHLSTYVSLMADESTDVSNTSQLAVCVRYALNGLVKERLVDLVDVSKDKSAAELSKAIKDSLIDKDIVRPDDLVVGQSYDGASNMAAEHNSVQRYLQNVWPHARFVHCYAHKLALVVKKACEDIRPVSDFFELTSTLCAFFRSSPKRQSFLHKRMPAAAYTRWLTRGKCVKHIHKHRHEIFDALEELSESSDSTTRFEAEGILRKLKTVENMFLLNVFHDIFYSADILIKMLQSNVIDCAKANRKLGDFRRQLDDMRSDAAFADMMKTLDKLEAEFEFTPPPRVRTRNEQAMRDSGYTPSQQVELTKQQKLKQCLVAILDGLSVEFDARFGNLTCFSWMKMLDPTEFDALSGRSNANQVRAHITNLKESNPFIKASTESILSQFQTLYGDSDLRKEIKDVKDIPSLLQKLYELDIQDALPLVTDICNLASSMAITSVACERTFSVLRRMKNYQRNRMGQDRTKHLMILSVESELTCKLAQDSSFYDKIIDRFAAGKDRRIDLIFK